MPRISSFPSTFAVLRLTAITTSLFLHALIAAASAISLDGLALLAFKSAISGDPTSALASWTEDNDPCHWPGIFCANITSSKLTNRVVAIALTGKNLSGYIPSELGSLVFLRRLNLHGNLLHGSIPSQLFNAASLHSLFLYDNNLSGPLPPTLCDPPRLQNVDLSDNSISGTLPAELAGCHQLQRLSLAGNQVSGRVPTGIWFQLVRLVKLDISSNRLEGPLTADIGALDSLTGTLNLSHNRFSGPIPKSLGSIPLAVILDLSYNNFSGEIPQSGSLANQGLNAFLHNPGLCGFPLRIPCSEASEVQQTRKKTAPQVKLSSHKRKGLRPGLIVLIAVADAAGVSLAGLILVYLYWKMKDRVNENGCSCRGKSKLGGDGSVKTRWQCGHCLKGGEVTEEDDDQDLDQSTASINNEAGEGKLVSLDKGFRFELDELFRSSAYVLGKSAQGIVYKVVLGNGVPVAVRRLGGGGGQQYQEFAAEVRTIAKARHPNVVRLRAFYWSQEEKLIISDFIPYGNLAAALRGKSNQLSLSWPIRFRIAKGVARGLAFLHECSPIKFIHGDIKPSNILLGNDYNPFICDFGLARLLSFASTTATIIPNETAVVVPPPLSTSGGIIGAVLPLAHLVPEKPNPYRAPEARASPTCPTQKWDAYSFGVVLLELLTGRQPETGSPPLTVVPGLISSTSCLATREKSGVPELVRWVHKRFEEVCPLSEIVDPVLQDKFHPKQVEAVFRIALACVDLNPEVRPRMKAVFESLVRFEG